MCVKKSAFPGVLEGCLGFLTGHLKNMVILDIMYVLGGPQGPYPESAIFKNICQGYLLTKASVYLCKCT